jgi:DNA-binding transcriptional MerR regulator/glutaredoxin
MRKDQPSRKIGELAQRLGLNVRTLRYYEKIGLLPPPTRTESGYRLYSEADERLLRFVLQAKRMGFTLEEIRQIMRRSRHGSVCDYVRETLRQHIEALDAKIAEFQRTRKELQAAENVWQEMGDAHDGTFCGLIERWSDPLTGKEVTAMAGKRQVEVFTAGCPLCDPVVELVKRIACDDCDVTVYNLHDDADAAERAKALNVHRVPMVLVNGQPADGCQFDPVTEAGLRAAGIGA